MRDWIENVDTGEVRIRTHAAKGCWRERWNNLEVRIELEVAKYEDTDKIFEEWEIFLLERDLAYDEYDVSNAVRLAHGDSLEAVMEQLATAAYTLNKGVHRMGSMAYTAKYEKLEAYDAETIDGLRIRQASRAEDNKQTTVAGVIEAYNQVMKNHLNASIVTTQVPVNGKGYQSLTISNPLRGGESSGTDSEIPGQRDGQAPE